MVKRAVCQINIAGMDVSTRFAQFLISVRVNDKVGTHSDTATIDLDDTDGRISMPQDRDPVQVLLGWEGGGVRQVFDGFVDEIRSSGSRGGGRILTIGAKGMDTKAKPKQPQQRHFDDKTIKDVLTDAGKFAGITSIEVDPALEGIKREYVEMRDESFIHLGERLAREVGGNFRISGTKGILSLRGGGYTSFVNAAWGDNLHAWDISPTLGRPQFNKARARWYDRAKAKWEEEEVSVQLQADAEHVARYSEPNKDQSKNRTDSDKATSERDSAEGSVTIEGNTEAIPDGLCNVSGTRSGIDGPYRIEAVEHEYSRGGGYTTKLDLKSPAAGGGSSSGA
jgi:uncharacterized protein